MAFSNSLEALPQINSLQINYMVQTAACRERNQYKMQIIRNADLRQNVNFHIFI